MSTHRPQAERAPLSVRCYLHIKETLKAEPWVFSALWRSQESDQRYRKVVRPDFDVVIEGFARSGNTFATVAFKSTPGNEALKVANHFHTSAQIALAARWSIPCVLLVREPQAAVLSNAVFRRRLSIGFLLRQYIAFHRKVWPFRSHVVVADFPQVVADFGSVIERLNQTSGAKFAVFNHTEENAERVMQQIDQHHNQLMRTASQLETESQRTVPSPAKEQAKRDWLPQLAWPQNKQLLDQASELYTQLTSNRD